MDRLRDFDNFPFQDFDRYNERLRQIRHKVPYVVHLGTGFEAVALYELAAGFHDDIEGYVLEFGTFAGWSTTVMAIALQRYYTNYNVVYTVDPYSWYPEALPVARGCFYKLGLEKNICQVLWRDLDFVKRLWRLPTRLIYIDAGHGYEHVKESLDLCFSILLDGGWIAFHDYNTKAVKSVVRALHEFIDSSGYNLSVFRVDSLVCFQKCGKVSK